MQLRPRVRNSPAGARDAKEASADAPASLDDIDYKLVTSGELPAWYTHAPFVETGYRRCRTFASCACSVVKLHNESVNIWLHLPVAFFLLPYLAYLLQRSDVDVTKDFDLAVVCVSVFFGNVTTLLLSGVCHTFFCLSQRAHNFCWFMDFIGLQTGILGGGIGIGHFSFKCHPALYATYFSSMAVMYPFFMRLAWKNYRVHISTTAATMKRARECASIGRVRTGSTATAGSLLTILLATCSCGVWAAQLTNCNGFMVVQADDRWPAPKAHQDIAESMPVYAMTAMTNAKYAASHGYCYRFYAGTSKNSTQTARRHPSWDKLQLLIDLRLELPSLGLLFLDSDAYVRSHEPLTRMFNTRDMRLGDKLIAVALQDIWYKDRFRWKSRAARCNVTEVTCAKKHGSHVAEMMNGAWADTSHLSTRFGRATAAPWFYEELNHYGPVNAGIILQLPGARGDAIIRAWMDYCDAPERNCSSYYDTFPWEQAALSLMLKQNKRIRRDVRYMNGCLDNGPEGVTIRHLWGETKRQASYLRDLRERARSSALSLTAMEAWVVRKGA